MIHLDHLGNLLLEDLCFPYFEREVQAHNIDAYSVDTLWRYPAGLSRHLHIETVNWPVYPKNDDFDMRLQGGNYPEENNAWRSLVLWDARQHPIDDIQIGVMAFWTLEPYLLAMNELGIATLEL